MIAAVVMAASLASDYAARFWDQDLAGLARELAEHHDDHSLEHELFADLVRLIDCEPLPEVAPQELSAPRAAIRLEAARRLRLGEAAAHSTTVWRDILNPSFFQRDPTRGEPKGELLSWPDDDEPWPGETLRIEAPVSRCTPMPAYQSELDLVPLTLIEQAEHAGRRDLASRLAYHRTILLLQQGQQDEARIAAAHIAPESLPMAISSFGKLMRLETGVDPRAGYATLINDRTLGTARLTAVIQVCTILAETSRWSDVETLTAWANPTTSTGSEGTQAQLRYLLAQRARALQHLNRTAELTALLQQAFPALAEVRDPSVDALRAIALTSIASRPFDSKRVTAFLNELGPADKQVEYWTRLGEEVLAGGDLKSATQIADQLMRTGTPAARTAGLSFRARVAFGRNDARAFDQAVAALFEDGRSFSAREARAARDDAAVVLAEELVDQLASAPRSTQLRHVSALLDRCERTVGWRQRARVLRLRQALDQLTHGATSKPGNAVTVGEVRMMRQVAPLVPPTTEIAWPEIPSLLAIPTVHGGWRDWFSPEAN